MIQGVQELIDIIQRSARGERDDTHTAMPGQVTKYYPTTQRADIQPLVKRVQFNDDGSRGASVPYPVLPKVPILWRRAGGFQETFPLEPGDFVWIMFAECATGEFLQSGQLSEPFDVSRHQITYPTAIPGFYPFSQALTDSSVTGNDRLVLGKEAGPQIQITGSNIILAPNATPPLDKVALASKVNANFSSIVSQINAAAVAANAGGTAPVIGTVLGTLLANLATGINAALADVESALVQCS